MKLTKAQKIAVELVELNAQIKEMVSHKKEEEKPLREGLKKVAETWEPLLAPLEKRDALLRTEVTTLRGSDTSIVVEGIGSLVFPETYNFEILDANSVPREYLTVDTAKVMEAVKKGVRKIKGINIEKRYWKGMQVRQWKEEE